MARPGPARPGCSVPRFGCPTWSEARVKGLEPGSVSGRPHGKTADCTARACARADGAASSVPSLLPAPVAAATAPAGPGARGPGPLPRPGIDDGPRTRAARCRKVVLSCHEFRVACKALQLRAQSSGLQGQAHRADRPAACSRSAASVARRAVRVMCDHALLRACTIDRATGLRACTIDRGPADGRAAPSHGVPACRPDARPP